MNGQAWLLLLFRLATPVDGLLAGASLHPWVSWPSKKPSVSL
jgi:hypothetical protein